MAVLEPMQVLQGANSLGVLDSVFGAMDLQGYLAHKKMHPPGTLP